LILFYPYIYSTGCFQTLLFTFGSFGSDEAYLRRKVCKFLNFNFYQSSALILQAGTPTAISTILMAEAYGVKQKIASKILFTTTLISIITIPLLKMFMNLFI